MTFAVKNVCGTNWVYLRNKPSLYCFTGPISHNNETGLEGTTDGIVQTAINTAEELKRLDRSWQNNLQDKWHTFWKVRKIGIDGMDW